MKTFIQICNSRILQANAELQTQQQKMLSYRQNKMLQKVLLSECHGKGRW
jgi:hypothetical protein